jgi:hypothetical protein
VGYIADEELRGSLPFQRYVFMLSVDCQRDNNRPRSREEELLYVLKKLLNLQLWPGTLWAALSSSPSQYAVRQPCMYGSPPPLLSLIIFVAIETSLDPKGLITDAVRRSPKHAYSTSITFSARLPRPRARHCPSVFVTLKTFRQRRLKPYCSGKSKGKRRTRPSSMLIRSLENA